MGSLLERPLKADGTQYLSGTEWEYEDACRDAEAHGRRVLVYRCIRDPQVSLRDPKVAEKKRQLDFVDEFFKRFTGAGGGLVGGYTSYGTPEEFEGFLEKNLRQLLKAFIEQRRPAGRGPRSDGEGKRTKKSAVHSATSLIVPDLYRAWLKKETGSLELLGLGGSQGRSFFLSSVYVPLVVAGGDRDEGAKVRLAVESSMREQSALPLLHALGSQSLYVPGGPGSGKSTFCRWVAWLVCEGAMPKADVECPEQFAEAFPASFAGKLPVLVPLREFWEKLPVKPAGASLTAHELAVTLDGWLQERTTTARGIDLRSFIDSGRALVLFDGVDEVPTSHPRVGDGNPHQLLLSGLSHAVKEWRPKGNILLLTSRPYGLTEDEAKRVGLEAAPIADLPSELQQVLARRWFRIQKQDAERGDASAEDLTRDITERDWLRPLAANPLMLTAMCAIYSDGGKLPQDRHQLYDRIVDSVLTKRYADPIRRGRVRFELCAIAHAMHTGDVFGPRHPEPLPQATFDEAELALRKDAEVPSSQKESVLGPREARQNLLAESGLLTAVGDRRLAFYHFSVQEFLAAERTFDLHLPNLKSVFVERASVPNWRNTLSFLFGRYTAAFTAPTPPLALLHALIDLSEETFGAQLVVGDCAEMLVAKGYALDEARAARLRGLLSRAMATRASAKDRCEAGAVLGKIGDPRFDPDRWFLPSEAPASLGFLRVEAGSFQMGSDSKHDKSAFEQEQPRHSVELPAFFIAAYPVTVAQFKAFVEASGFVPEDRDCLRGIPNHPVVSVSWHEALKYCDWLTETLCAWKDAPRDAAVWLDATVRDGWLVTLPSEAEWEKAARGTDGGIYPWGDKFDANLPNTYETGIYQTSAVGAFPGGASPCGAHDMSGNVWEWTRSLWSRGRDKPVFGYPYRPDDHTREDLRAPDEAPRVVRGGSFGYLDLFARAAYRFRVLPDSRVGSIGFRVVVARARAKCKV